MEAFNVLDFQLNFHKIDRCIESIDLSTGRFSVEDIFGLNNMSWVYVINPSLLSIVATRQLFEERLTRNHLAAIAYCTVRPWGTPIQGFTNSIRQNVYNQECDY